MNPDQGGPGDRPPEVFGRTPAAAARAALLLALLGVAMIAGLARYFTRPGTPLGEVYRATGLPRDLFLVAGSAVVVALAAAGYWKSVRTADQFRLTPAGLEIRGP